MNEENYKMTWPIIYQVSLKDYCLLNKLESYDNQTVMWVNKIEYKQIQRIKKIKSILK